MYLILGSVLTEKSMSPTKIQYKLKLKQNKLSHKSSLLLIYTELNREKKMKRKEKFFVFDSIYYVT